MLTKKIGFENQILATLHYINSQNEIISFESNDFWPKTFLILYPSTSHITRVVSSSVRICRKVVNFWTSCPWPGACTFPVIQKYKHIRNYFEMLKYIYNKGYKESSKKVFPSSKKILGRCDKIEIKTKKNFVRFSHLYSSDKLNKHLKLFSKFELSVIVNLMLISWFFWIYVTCFLL